MSEHPGLLISILLALGIGAQWFGWFSKKPAIIYLLAIGIILGPTLHWFNPDAMLGQLLFPLISLGVAIILFEGALTLKLQEIKSHGRVVTNLVTIGVLITIAVATGAAWLFMNMDFELALLFGALVSVTGPTVIVPLLRSVRPNKTISNILRWEGVIIDPIGALLVVLVYEYIIAGHSPIIFAQTILLGLTFGVACALLLAVLLRRHWIPEYLNNVATLALVLLVFSLSNALIEESGLLTVTVMGMVLANSRNLPTDEILDFKESLSLIIISMLFIILSARIDFSGFARMGLSGIGVLLVIMFIARPLSVWVSALGSKLKRNEKILISWIAPRGIVAAAVSSLFVLKIDENANGADVLVPLVFTIIIGTVIIQSLTAKPFANWLGVADPNPNGVLISGINSFTIKLGKAIKENGFDVILASTSYEQTAKARMEGLPVYYGNLVSEHADRHLSLVGMGHLLAMHPRSEQNMLTTLRYKSEFGERQVYRIKTNERGEDTRDTTYSEWHSAWLFNDKLTYNQLMSLDSEDAQIRTTNLSENYDFTQYQIDNPNAITLFALNPVQKLFMFSSKASFSPSKGWKIISLQPYAKEKAAEKISKRQQERISKSDDSEQSV